MIQRYRVAFLLSLLVFVTLWAVYLNLPKVKKEPKKIEKQVIKISLISPAIPKKIIVKKTKPILPTVVPKPKPKKVVKKKVVKKKIIKKKVIKKILKKKIIKKKVTKKKIITKPMKQPTPVVPPVYVAHKAITKPKTKEPILKASSEPQSKVKNDHHKKAFLENVRSKIIANKKYPKIAKRRHIEGSVKVRFDITVNGQVTNIRFINGKRVFQKSIRKTLERTFPVSIPNRIRAELPMFDVSVTLHFNII